MGYETSISSDYSDLRLARGDKTGSKDCKLGSRGRGKLLDLRIGTTYFAQTDSKDRVSLYFPISMDWFFLAATLINQFLPIFQHPLCLNRHEMEMFVFHECVV